VDRRRVFRPSRWNVRRPGFGRARASASICCSSVVSNAASVSPPGFVEPGGGIIPSCSFAMTFSDASGDLAAAPTSKSSSERLPRRTELLWQRAQERLTTSLSAAVETSLVKAPPGPGCRACPIVTGGAGDACWGSGAGVRRATASVAPRPARSRTIVVTAVVRI